jgi:glucose/arabinose dehydrogenase
MMRARALAATAGALALLGVAALGACSNDDASTGGPSVTFATQPGTAPLATTATTAPSAAPSSAAPSSAAPSSAAPSSVAPTVAAPTTDSSPRRDPVIALADVGGASQPVDVAWRTGDSTAYLVEQAGRVIPVRDGTAGTPVLDISDLTNADGERGLLGLTFTGDGTLAYIDHTDTKGNTVIAEYAVAADGTFDPASRRVLLHIDQPYPNHNGGNVMIGPDHLLYIGMGDGGSGGDPKRHALNVSSLLGKILRIDPTPHDNSPYTVPADNPFVGVAGARPEIWAVGVRNPWRSSFDSLTGDLWIGDVGQSEIEEVDVAYADPATARDAGRGFNFGWSAYEASKRFNDDQSPDGVTPPIYEYPHGDDGCSITGGAVYRGTAIADLVGWYVFGDYCSGNVWGLSTDGGSVRTLLLAHQAGVTSIRADPTGELFATSIDGRLTTLVAG